MTVVAPFFPRYLFITLDLSRDQWRNINSTFGVSSLVMAGERPHPVPPGVVEAMIAATDENGLLSFEHSLKVGAAVRLLAGPFADQLGVLERLDHSGRVRVLLDIMGGSVPVRVARAARRRRVSQSELVEAGQERSGPHSGSLHDSRALAHPMARSFSSTAIFSRSVRHQSDS